jgi:CelD/BcsL family acetyltransferase involved in cellulose biosynthesis
MSRRLRWVFLALVALLLVIRPAPTALRTDAGTVPSDQPDIHHHFEVNVARLARRRAQGQAGDLARWIELDIETAVTMLSDEWRRLAETSETPPTVNPMWQRAYWRAFHTTRRAPRVHALWGGEGVAAVIPVRRTGQLVRRWSFGVNAHTPYVSLALGRSPEVAIGALEHLMGSAEMLDLGPLYTHGPATATLARVARERGFRVRQDARGTDAVIDLPASPAEFHLSLSRKLVGNTFRAHRQLTRLGRLDFEVLTGGPALAKVLAECFTLETLGWKGQRGVPIRSRPDTLRFYSELAEAAADAGRLALYTLRLNSALIAFEYCLRHEGRIDLLKLSFHPDFSHYSPGNVLRFLLLEHEIKSGQGGSYHMGLAGGWKTRWATRSEPLCRLRIYDRGVRGTVAYVVNSTTGHVRQQAGLLRAAGHRMLGLVLRA